MRNIEIAWSLKELSDLLEFKGEDYFKIRAYRRAAKTLVGLPSSAAEMYRNGTLKDVPGVGKNILAKIGELIETGECDLLRRLREEIPPGIVQVMAVPGMGPKRTRVFYEQLEITSIKELEKAARSRRIRSLPGMGAKREQEILRNIKMLNDNLGSFILSTALEIATEFVQYLSELPDVDNVAVAGSVRRWRETVQDVDILVSTLSPQDLLSTLNRHPLVNNVSFQDERRANFITTWGIPGEILTVPSSCYIPALVWCTGNNGHWTKLKDIALSKGYKLEAEGVFEHNGTQVPVASEEDFYHKLGLEYIPPEMREDRGEIEQAQSGNLPQVLREAKMRGDLHIHSNWSDGGNSIEELVNKAKEKGYSYLAITDHSQSLKIARGLPVERLLEQWEYIDGLNRELKGFQVLKGIEVDILSNGELDYPDQILSRADVVVASVHSGFKQEREKITGRIVAAIENPHVDIIGHLTGRLIGHRSGYDVDVEKVIKKAAENNTALEINSSPDRLDLDEFNARLAAEYGVMLAINTDAHDLRRMDEMIYGIAVSRRAWLGADNILNTKELPELLSYLR
ncbi:MAG: DNA polymerase/3'-5' exonuclease PolX [Firmicutes bacterium]|nr:DNA polymerase/3'-5' exonuclease PolX [Bacillota bacterium]